MSRPSGLLLGFDYGQKRIGVAVGQRLTATARPLVTLATRNGAPDWEAIGRLLREWQPEALVVGVPTHADGSEFETTRAARRFGNRLAGRYNLRVHFVDETLTSAAAESLLSEAGALRDCGELDRVAAQLILETWLHQNSQ